MKFSIKDFAVKGFPWIWSHVLKKSSMENFIFCAVDAFGFFGVNFEQIQYIILAFYCLFSRCDRLSAAFYKRRTSKNLLIIDDSHKLINYCYEILIMEKY